MTMGRSKIPSNLAYAVSAATMQEILACVPQKDEITVDCSYSKTMTPRRFEKTKMGRANKTFRDSSRDIITARYERRPVSLSTPTSWQEEGHPLNNYADHRWKLYIHAVPLTDLSAVRKCLDAEGYKRITDWFIDKNKYAGAIGGHVLIVAFDGKHLTYHLWDNF